uniref:Uncharacterized protein n=1 Tax=Kalanchoe fedtschenkoi TaxID=63787 RepID=A0A7N0TKF8_KALFE
MGESWRRTWPPTGSPQLISSHRDDSYDPSWKQFDSSVNAVSFGFVATAILISMFLIMAIVERFIRPASFSPGSRSSGRRSSDVEAQMGFDSKLGLASPKMSVYSRGVSVLMPGEDVPTFIAHPAPCPPERVEWPLHQPSPSSSARPISLIRGTQ